MDSQTLTKPSHIGDIQIVGDLTWVSDHFSPPVLAFHNKPGGREEQLPP